MAIKIGHASIDENGKVSGGKVGDQTKKEICTRLWYNKPWNVYLVCTDEKIANIAATFMEQICADENYGYDQGERLTGYNSIIKNGGKVKGGKGEFDCSSLISACYIFAGLKLSPACTTRSLKAALLATGKFIAYTESKYLTSDIYAKRGGIYLKEGSHVVMALENAVQKKKNNPYVEPKDSVEFGELGISVRWAQWELNYAGFATKVDGEFGSNTDKQVKAFQEKYNLKIDGKVGPITRAKLKSLV
ncbi:MAG: cell surface protein [Sedimentibacter sp.]|jgi:hypothetical protein|nr:cell surface protein [Sedimentibacter sp.]